MMNVNKNLQSQTEPSIFCQSLSMLIRHIKYLISSASSFKQKSSKSTEKINKMQ